MGWCIVFKGQKIFVRILWNLIINIVLDSIGGILIQGSLMNVFLTFMMVVSCIIIIIKLSFIVYDQHVMLIVHCKMACLTLFILICTKKNIQLLDLLFY